ncbi:MAG: O-methyltransferase [Nocardioidaceae bacterium]
MSRMTETITPDLQAYIVAHNRPGPDDVLLGLAAETEAAMGDLAEMQVAPEQGALMTLLTKLVAPRFAVEVGTFTGYSALCIARGLPAGGRLLCCDVSEEYADIAQRHWERAGVLGSIELRVAPAADTLRGLPADQVVDLAFLDADKDGYVDYWEEVVGRMRPGGVVLVDNVFAGGRVLEPGTDHRTGKAIQRFNDHAAADARVELAMVPIGDGLTVARRV